MIFLLILLTLISIKPYLSQEFPYTHDGENHLARFANYKIALKEGQFPPRFAPNLLNHYGYPVFNYNYPLANILSVPFSILKINYEVTFKILVFGFVFAGLYGINLWLKQLQFDTKTRYFSLATFAVTPYLINALSYRGNIGEIMALCLFPWLLYFIEKPAESYKKEVGLFLGQTIVWLMFFLSHNIAVLFGTPLLLIYGFYKYKTTFIKQSSLLLSIFLALISSLWFWLPAVFEKNLVILDNADLSTGFTRHFPTLSQLFYSPLEFGFSKVGSVDSLSFQVGLTQLLGGILGIIFILKNKLNKYTLFIFSLISLLFILQLSFTQPLWSSLPLAHYIQFPWRLSLFISVFILPLISFIFMKGNNLVKSLFLVTLCIQIGLTLQVTPADYFHRQIVNYDAFSQTTTTANENFPKDFTYKEFADWQPTATILSGEGTVKVSIWRGSTREYQLDLITPSIIVEPTAFFAGWETTVQDLTTNQNLEVSYLDDDEIQGRLAYLLPAGQYTVTSTFTQNTLPRKVGNTLSGIGIGALVLLSLYAFWDRWQRKNK
jgi:hypothetical protein